MRWWRELEDVENEAKVFKDLKRQAMVGGKEVGRVAVPINLPLPPQYATLYNSCVAAQRVLNRKSFEILSILVT